MLADLRALRSRDIWYRSKEDRFVPGKLTQLTSEEEVDGKVRILGQICLEAGDWGVNWLMDNVPYGPGRLHNWYFHEPTEETRTVMANLGVTMSDDDMVPQWKQMNVQPLQKKTKGIAMPFQPPPAPNAPLTADLVEATVEKALEKHSSKGQKNGADNTASKGAHLPGRTKAAAAN